MCHASKVFRDMMAAAEKKAVAEGIRFFAQGQNAKKEKKREHNGTIDQTPVMIVGRRTNYEFDQGGRSLFWGKPSFYEVFDRDQTCGTSHDLMMMSYDGTLMDEYAVDYFIFTPGAIDWSKFPPYLVGNVAYDQALIGHARRAGTVLIDATNSVHAFHMTGRDGNSAGHQNRNDGVIEYNRNLWAEDGFADGMRDRPEDDDKAARPWVCVDLSCCTHSMFYTREYKLAIATTPINATAADIARGAKLRSREDINIHTAKNEEADTSMGPVFKSPCGAAIGWLTEKHVASAPSWSDRLFFRDLADAGERFPLVTEALDFGFLLHATQRCSAKSRMVMNRPILGDWASDPAAAASVWCVTVHFIHQNQSDLIISRRGEESRQ
jgi:hypothetical protein